jgi:elongation factor P
MISAGEFRNGVTIEFEGSLYTIIDFQHVKPGKGAAFVRSTLKNMESGAVLEKTFRPTEKMARAHIDRRDLQYLYSDGQLFHFMDVESFEQSEMNAAQIGDNLRFVKENDMIKVLVHNGRVFGIEPPMFVELAITDTEPGFRGDTATGGGGTKPATVETGATVKVPLFVNTGDVIKIDTRTGEYLGRV